MIKKHEKRLIEKENVRLLTDDEVKVVDALRAYEIQTKIFLEFEKFTIQQNKYKQDESKRENGIFPRENLIMK